ncbi:MAG: cytochrome c maturation protein CcmE [Ferruginibacter sp.]
MKKTHIIILVGIAALIVGLLTYAVDFSSYESIQSAKGKKGKSVTLIAKLDKSQGIVYDPIHNPNYLSFYAVDSLGGKTKVVYRDNKPTDLERSERIVMKGTMKDDHFECKSILLKCPSKYKDDKRLLEKNINEQTTQNYKDDKQLEPAQSSSNSNY